MIPNVLAARYASPELVRALVAGAQGRARAPAVDRRAARPSATSASTCPTASIEAYERVVDEVDLASIAARERVTRHDVKARIEEFAALAGHEHIHKGMTSRDLTENVEQLQIRRVARARPRPHGRRARPPGPPRRRARDARDDRPHATTSPPRPPRSASASRRAADELLVALERLEDLLARYPLRGIKGPMGTAQDMLDLLDGDARPRSPTSSSASPSTSASTRVLDQRRPGLPALARLRRGLARCVQLAAGPSNLATTIRLMAGPRAGHRGLPARPGRLAPRCRTR